MYFQNLIYKLAHAASVTTTKFATTFFSDLFLERIVAKLADMWEELNSLLKSICMCFWAHAKKIPSDSAKFINLDMPRIYQKQKNTRGGGGGAEPFLARKKTTTVFQLLLLLYFSGVVEYLIIIEKFAYNFHLYIFQNDMESIIKLMIDEFLLPSFPYFSSEKTPCLQ